MIYRARICFTTNFLGGGPRDKNSSVRALKRTYDNDVEINSAEFYKNLELANKQIKGNLEISKFKIPEGFYPEDNISVIRRVYNRVNIDLFEGILKGNKVYIDIMHNAEVKDSPSIETLKKLLDIVGKFHGISQWGSKFNCGRFKVLNIEKVTIKNYDN